MSKIYSVTADRERLSGPLAWALASTEQPQPQSFFYAVWEREFMNGLLVSERMAAAGAGYPSRVDALQDGLKVLEGFELTEEQLLQADRERNVDKAQRLAAANDDRALALQVAMDRCWGAIL